MPTGYTAKLCEQEVPFQQFIMTCARNFGALISLRDDPLSKKIPKKLKVDGYYIRKLVEINKEVKRLEQMTPDEAVLAAEGEYRTLKESEAQCNRDNTKTRDRLLRMMRKVEAWLPPTPDHLGLKRFMLDQLTISLPPEPNAFPKIERKTGKEWMLAKLKRLREDIVYYTTKREEEVQRVAGCNHWLQELRRSIR